MLEAMRRGVANILAKILLGLLIVAFAVWGIGDYIVRGPTGGGALATVGKTEITVSEFQQAYKDEMQSIASKLGRALTPEQAQVLGVPPRTLARLIGTAAIDLHANNLGVTIADPLVASIIKADPRFQGIGGEFDRTKFRQILSQRGYRSEEEYIRASRRDLLREQLTETLSAGVAPQQFLVDAVYRFRDETRVIEHLTPDFTKLVTVAEPAVDKLTEFFEQNKRQYIALEERKANLLLVTRDTAMARVKIGDDEVKAAYETAKDSYNVPEKRRVSQLTFADKAAAEKAYAELSKAKDFNEAAAKLGFPAADIDLGVLTKPEMIDPKIAEAAFGLKKNELSPPVAGQFSTVLLRVTEIEPGKQRSFDEVKGEVRDRIAAERVGQQLQAIHEKVEAGRAKGTPLKEIADELKLPFQEIPAINRLGKTNDGTVVIAHPDAGRIAEAIFAGTPGVETDIVELSDTGFAWFDLIGVTPERQRDFEEVKAEVRAHFMEAERRKEIASLAAKEIEALQPGEGLARIAKALGGKVERTAPVKRTASPPPAGFTAAMLQQAFALPEGGVASAPTVDGKSRTILRVADVIAAPPATDDQIAALKADLTKQMRVDILDQYVGGLRARYGFSVNEKLVMEALGGQQTQPETEMIN
jgi:peptidyl-prolyl cis-trans isomerase D